MGLRVVAIACSARKYGNCRDIAWGILNRLGGMGVETELLLTADYEINPCNRCNYECFYEGERCPLRDDVPVIWGKMRAADGIILVVPSYYGLPPATFKAIIERAQGILGWVTRELRDLEGVWKEKPVITVVLADGGGEIMMEYFRRLFRSAKLILKRISYKEYGRSGFERGLIDLPEVSLMIDELAEEFHSKLLQKAEVEGAAENSSADLQQD